MVPLRMSCIRRPPGPDPSVAVDGPRLGMPAALSLLSRLWRHQMADQVVWVTVPAELESSRTARIVRRPSSRVGVVPHLLALRTEMVSSKINQRAWNLYRSESQKTLRRSPA